MWIKLGNGRVVLTHHEAHITRLLNEGGQEVPDPTIPPARVEEAEPDGSTLNDGKSDSAGENHDRRSRRRKPAVQ